MRVIGSVLLGALCAVAIACGSSQKTSATGALPPMANTGAAGGAPGSPRSQIEELDGAIRADLARMNLPEPAVAPTCDSCATPMGTDITLPTADANCKHGTSDTCRDSCKLADSICSNASKICTLAGEMNNDAWANGKCVEGKTSCDNAKKRCCDCQL